MTATCSDIARPTTMATAAMCATRYWPAIWRDVTFTTPGGCQVQSGVLHDLYTGKTIDFVRGPQTSSAVQIEHVVALENAWQSGARDWDTAKRYKFGNDMYNLLAADGEANSEKGSASAAYWLPTNADFRCEYVARQIGVKDKYDLSVTTKEKQAMAVRAPLLLRSGGARRVAPS